MRDSKTVGRLKELRYEQYVKDENKEQEKFVEEYLAQLTINK
jgi:hypothetical protein